MPASSSNPPTIGGRVSSRIADEPWNCHAATMPAPIASSPPATRHLHATSSTTSMGTPIAAPYG
ncbi:MAG: hypothetical protein DYG92_11940 [Leptolyngbya sp. PLA1]|nr:hypothetical protein [Leptolyngbya sp. PLA1]